MVIFHRVFPSAGSQLQVQGSDYMREIDNYCFWLVVFHTVFLVQDKHECFMYQIIIISMILWVGTHCILKRLEGTAVDWFLLDFSSKSRCHWIFKEETIRMIVQSHPRCTGNELSRNLSIAECLWWSSCESCSLVHFQKSESPPLKDKLTRELLYAWWVSGWMRVRGRTMCINVYTSYLVTCVSMVTFCNLSR